jgi:hypothetical protein
MKLNSVLLGLVCLVLAPPLSSAERRVCAGGPVVLKAAVGQLVDIVMEDGVGDLVRSGDPATLKVEHTSGHLFVTPLSRDPAGLVVIDGKGRSHQLKYVFEAEVDEKVTVADCPSEDGAGTQENVTVRLMRDLMRLRIPEGSTARKADETMFESAAVRLRAIAIYELPQAFGYVMVMENKETYPDMVAIASQKDILAPGESTGVYMVVRR